MTDIFTPIGATVNVAASVTTASVALTALQGAGGGSVRVHNLGPSGIFINFGAAAVTAVLASSIPIPSGAIEVFQLGKDITHAAAITSAGTATVYFTSGQGA